MESISHTYKVTQFCHQNIWEETAQKCVNMALHSSDFPSVLPSQVNNIILTTLSLSTFRFDIVLTKIHQSLSSYLIDLIHRQFKSSDRESVAQTVYKMLKLLFWMIQIINKSDRAAIFTLYHQSTCGYLAKSTFIKSHLIMTLISTIKEEGV